MTIQDPAAVPALPDRARPLRWRYYTARFLMIALLLALAAWLPGGRNDGSTFRYRLNQISPTRVVAPFDFRVEKDQTTLEREQAMAARAVVPVYERSERVATEHLSRFAMFEERAIGVAIAPDLGAAERADRLRSIGVPLSEAAAQALAAPNRARAVFRSMGPWLAEAYQTGIVAEKRNGAVLGHRSVQFMSGEGERTVAAGLLLDRREALLQIERRARETFAADPRALRLIAELAPAFVQPNVLPYTTETDWRRLQARAAVPALLGLVRKDELIVDANQPIDAATLLKLRSLHNLKASQRNSGEQLYPPLARMMLMLLFVLAFAFYLRWDLPAVYRDNGMLAMFTLLTAVVMACAEAVTGILGFTEFAVPLALAPLTVASLLEKRPALVFTLLLAMIAVAVSDLPAPFIPVAVLGGITAVYSVSRLRHRWHFARATLTIAAANVFAILAWDLARQPSAEVMMRDAAWGALNAFLSVSIAFLLLPIVEHVLGLTSDITLLELSDLNRPLLRRLQLEAPGTYHHSMVVGSLAEAAAEGIGANSLLARVMAYYHDIGKLAKPEYYAENEPASSRSRHDRLTPSMSTLVVKSHITEGLEMARRQRLPRAVQNAIPEHHGTMVMAFFYHKALEQDPGARREDFSYPGPRPRSKETAILMLADGVEGASRALAEPTPSRIRGLVTRILEERVQQGQLDECGLTLSDLARIREAFIPVLTAIFHVRAPYPEDPTRRRARSDADLRRES